MSSNNQEKTETLSPLVKLGQEMMDRTKDRLPLMESELDDVVQSIQKTFLDPNCDWEKLRTFLKERAHLNHKEWKETQASADVLKELLDPSSSAFEHFMTRVFTEGNWKGALQHATTTTSQNNDNDDSSCPWAVLVTGVNGIRKTTSMYQPWFQDLLAEALVYPVDNNGNDDVPVEKSTLPTGQNAFFRQLDHMIATVCNADFERLYRLTSAEMENTDVAVEHYSHYKAAIFSRYRTLSEILGIVLIQRAQSLNLNIMAETSGRDIGMFDYINKFFVGPYKKLALHFEINDLTLAQSSVDTRMLSEMTRGTQIVQNDNNKDVMDLIHVNAGGPYGSRVLPGVQRDSDGVWNKVLNHEDPNVNTKDWYLATIAITAYADRPWTAHAIKPDGTAGTVFAFEPPPATR